ncbi:fimbrial protein [Serratia fonticola]|uniref:Minor fimbrial protein prsF n=1 Tax=Serratia fonticola TaxID=47917 RepID=A0A448T650_SERFO|nr:fimbrial protein [Serratia fonticola]CAI1617611.1 Minor fimbrial protein prsF precursor [Serratia fonticola]VEI75473.1 Minor fimbrial protein prsF precursor [Serratia fonticola]
MNGTLRYRKVSCLLCGVLATLPLMAGAADTATITVKVTVLAPPPCTVNNNSVIEVPFGNVMTTHVDGTSYRVPVNYTLSCSKGASNAMKLQVQGNGASFDSTLLQTSKDGLGIELQQGNTKRAINSWLTFTYPYKPDLWAVPVKQPGVKLSGGQFRAGATMKVDYQ